MGNYKSSYKSSYKSGDSRVVSSMRWTLRELRYKELSVVSCQNQNKADTMLKVREQRKVSVCIVPFKKNLQNLQKSSKKREITKRNLILRQNTLQIPKLIKQMSVQCKMIFSCLIRLHNQHFLYSTRLVLVSLNQTHWQHIYRVLCLGINFLIWWACDHKARLACQQINPWKGEI